MNNYPVGVALILLNFGQFPLFTFGINLRCVWFVVVVFTLAVFVKYDVFYG